jgi:hypothetical protein
MKVIKGSGAAAMTATHFGKMEVGTGWHEMPVRGNPVNPRLG